MLFYGCITFLSFCSCKYFSNRRRQLFKTRRLW